jgi:hypothetical protein
MGARALWKSRYSRPFFSSESFARTLYPRLRDIPGAIERGDEAFDVVLLGASVLAPQLSHIGWELEEELIFRLQRRVRVWNVSYPAHTSRDSYFKYEQLTHVPFDLVIFYHGINELRANNVPPELFKEDYSHFAWYAFLNDPGRRSNRQRFLLPETVEFLGYKLRGRLGQLVPEHEPRPEWLEHGREYRSARALEMNLERIVALAAEKGEPVVLMTFAHYLDPKYSASRFRDRTLDYLRFEYPAELWGIPEAIDRGIEIHNAVIRSVASRHPGVHFVDQEALIPNGRRFFNDICHLTMVGARRWVENVVALPVFNSWARSATPPPGD